MTVRGLTGEEGPETKFIVEEAAPSIVPARARSSRPMSERVSAALNALGPRIAQTHQSLESPAEPAAPVVEAEDMSILVLGGDVSFFGGSQVLRHIPRH